MTDRARVGPIPFICGKQPELEERIGERLILPAKIERIEDIWRRDEIREDARQALDRSLFAATQPEADGAMAQSPGTEARFIMRAIQ